MNEEAEIKIREHDEILKLLERKGVVPDKEFIEQSIVTVPGEQDNLFEDFYKILEELNKDTNVFKLSTSTQNIIFPDSILATFGDVPNFPKPKLEDGTLNPDYIKPRYSFLKAFRQHYHVNLSAVSGRKLDKFTEIAGAFVQLKAMMDMQQARLAGVEGNNQLGSGKMDKIKGLFRKK